MQKTDQLNLLRQAKNWVEVESFARRELEADPLEAFYLRALEQSLREQGKTDDLPGIWKLLADDLNEPHPYALWLAKEVLGKGDAVQAVVYFRLGLQGALRAKDFDSVEEIWLELVDLIPEELDYFLGIAAELERRRERARAGELLQLLLPYHESGGADSLLRLLRRIADLMPRDQRMRVEAERVFRRLYGGRRDLSYLIEQSGLTGETVLPEAIAQLERYLSFGAGQRVFHQDWGTGVVSRLDPKAGKMVIDFPSRRGHAMGFDLAQKTLEPLAADDLRALSPEEVRRLKDTDPTALVSAALRSCGGRATGRELKDRLVGAAVAEDEWSGWWAAASRGLKVHPRIQVTGGGSRAYRLREEEIRFEDEVRDRFDGARKSPEKVDAYLGYLAHCREYAPDSELLGHMVNCLRSLETSVKDPAAGVEIAYVLERVREVAADVPVPELPGFEDILVDSAQAARLMERLRIPEHQSRWARRIREVHPEEWPRIFADLLLSPSVSVRDQLADALLEVEGGKERVRAVFEKASAAPRDYTGPFIWFCGRWILRPEEGEGSGQNACSLLERLLRLLDHVAFAGRRAKGKAGIPIRQHAADIRGFVKRDNFRAVRDVLERAVPMAAESLRRAVVSNAGLDPVARAELLRIIRTRFPHLAETDQESEDRPTSPAQSGVLCTRASLERKRAELRRLAEIEIPANAREIEEARAHGDLSENAEYKFAKERQAMLHDRARDLQEALLRARPIDLGGVSTDRVGFGTRVTLCSEAGETVVYTILGPWELESSQAVLSYLSDEAAALMGIGPGGRVEVSIGDSPVEFEVVAIEKATEAG